MASLSTQLKRGATPGPSNINARMLPLPTAVSPESLVPSETGHHIVVGLDRVTGKKTERGENRKLKKV